MCDYKNVKIKRKLNSKNIASLINVEKGSKKLNATV